MIIITKLLFITILYYIIDFLNRCLQDMHVGHIGNIFNISGEIHILKINFQICK